MNSYKLPNVETQCLASHCSIKISPDRDAMPCISLFDQKITDETQSIASLHWV
ncbi:MAG: hypothetical protein LBB88_00830 [Planctomycetaceae bacterium]|nr:hypothetical protein [Planctomycetaceae bacterium]